MILIVSRNNLHLTKKAVASALAQTEHTPVLVIDNDSQDGTVNWLNTKSELHTILLPGQISLAAAWNMGIRKSWSVKAEEILIINNDVEIRPDTYQMLQESTWLDQGSHPFISCVSVDTKERMGHPGDRQITNIFLDRRPHPDFSCFMMNRQVTDKVGFFDETYFPAYCEDCDYHVRMHRAGIEAVCIDLPFLHHGASTLKYADHSEGVRIQRGADINRRYFKNKYGCLPGTPEYSKLFEEV